MAGEERDESSHVTVTIVSPDFAGAAQTTTVSGKALTVMQVLDLFESALRGAGYHCPFDSLNIVDDSK